MAVISGLAQEHVAAYFEKSRQGFIPWVVAYNLIFLAFFLSFNYVPQRDYGSFDVSLLDDKIAFLSQIGVCFEGHQADEFKDLYLKEFTQPPTQECSLTVKL